MTASLVFVDTNVLLYARDSTEQEKHQRALAWMTGLWRTSRGRTSVQVLNEYYVNVTRKRPFPLEKVAAREDVEDLMAWEPAPASSRLLLRGFEVEERFNVGWWDSLVVAAALEQGCSWLLTEDLQHDQAIWDLRIVSPFRATPDEVLAS